MEKPVWWIAPFVWAVVVCLRITVSKPKKKNTHNIPVLISSSLNELERSISSSPELISTSVATTGGWTFHNLYTLSGIGFRVTVSKHVSVCFR